nr:unnamed protein product [Digitaria exilis]
MLMVKTNQILYHCHISPVFQKAAFRARLGAIKRKATGYPRALGVGGPLGGHGGGGGQGRAAVLEDAWGRRRQGGDLSGSTVEEEAGAAVMRGGAVAKKDAEGGGGGSRGGGVAAEEAEESGSGRRCVGKMRVAGWGCVGDRKARVLATLQRGVGGPVMDFDGDVIGMNFYDKKGTPFLPSFIVLKCLQHFKDFKKVIRPLHGLQVQNLYDAELTLLQQKIQCGLPEVYGVIVEKVKDSSVEHSEIKVGDVITHVNGVPFSNAAELGGILLDKCHKHMLERQELNLSEDCNQMAPVMNLKFRAITFRGCKSEVTTQTIIVDKFTPSSCGLNRWPLPKPIIIQRYAYGELIQVERYITDG